MTSSSNFITSLKTPSPCRADSRGAGGEDSRHGFGGTKVTCEPHIQSSDHPLQQVLLWLMELMCVVHLGWGVSQCQGEAQTHMCRAQLDQMYDECTPSGPACLPAIGPLPSPPSLHRCILAFRIGGVPSHGWAAPLGRVAAPPQTPADWACSQIVGLASWQVLQERLQPGWATVRTGRIPFRMYQYQGCVPTQLCDGL